MNSEEVGRGTTFEGRLGRSIWTYEGQHNG
jgi:hypothetical protein